MKKLHPNSFVTFNAKWRKRAAFRDCDLDLTIPLYRILHIEKIVNETKEIHYNIFVTFGERKNRPDDPSLVGPDENKRFAIYEVNNETYLRLRKIVTSIDWQMGDKRSISEIVKEQVKEEVQSVKEEIIKTKASSPIMSLEIE